MAKWAISKAMRDGKIGKFNDNDKLSISEPLRYYRCPDCGSQIECKKGKTPYWLPKSEAHQIRKGANICHGKYIEITKEEFDLQ